MRILRPLGYTWIIQKSTVMAIAFFFIAAGGLFYFWQLYVSPWARFPGPKLAALSSWYAQYWEVYRKGQLTSHLEDLHIYYGPVVRYGPTHIHFNDPALYNEIYRWNPTFGKDPAFYGAPKVCSTFRESNIQKHAIRRQLISRTFTLTATRKQIPMIQQNCDNLSQKIGSLIRKGHTRINVFNMSRSIAADVLSTYVLGFATKCVHEDEEGFDAGFVRAIQHSSDHYFDSQNIFLVFWRLISPIVGGSSPLKDETLDEIKFSDALIKKFLSKKASLDEDTDESALSILVSANVTKNSHPSPELMAEGRSLLAAGINTTGFTLAATLFYIARDKDVQLLLQTELDVHHSRLSEQSTLELPYLVDTPFHPDSIMYRKYLTGFVTKVACIREGYRLAGTVSGRLPRIAGKGGVSIGKHFVPEGTVFGMSSSPCHLSPELFPDPFTFRPMRWISNDEPLIQKMRANLHPYGRGPRECLGKNVAHTTICLTIAAVLKDYTVTIEGTIKEIERIATFETLPKGGRIDIEIRPRRIIATAA